MILQFEVGRSRLSSDNGCERRGSDRLLAFFILIELGFRLGTFELAHETREAFLQERGKGRFVGREANSFLSSLNPAYSTSVSHTELILAFSCSILLAHGC